MKNIFFKIIHTILLILGILAIFFSTYLWIGSEEKYNQLKNDSLFLLFLNWFILNSIVIFLFLSTAILISLILGKNMRSGLSLKQIIKFEALLLFSVSITLILIKIFLL